MPAAPSPLLFSPILHPKVWGGDRLARFGKHVNRGDHVGESWELADLPTTSASGAGGGAARSLIASGPLAGRPLHDALLLWKTDLLGAAKPAPSNNPNDPGNFPLLVKFLDARENLSVQVHPSIAYTKKHPDAHLKTECWYILDAAPGAVIYKGVKPGVTREIFERHLREGDGAKVVDDMVAVPAVPGEMHNLPSGTVHALGAGVLVAEVQTPSDTTFRVYDWGRTGRELRARQALECITFGPARDATRLPPDAAAGRLVTTGYFTVDEVRLLSSDPVPVAPDTESTGRCHVIIVIDGHCELAPQDGSFAPLKAPLGSTALVPAALAAACSLRGTGRVLRVGVLGA